jgi:YggT family protein
LSIVRVVYLLVTIYFWLIVARAVLSWFRPGTGTLVLGIDRVLFKLTEPYLAVFRRIVPTGRAGSIGIDWSYTVALLVLFIVLQVVGRL